MELEVHEHLKTIEATRASMEKLRDSITHDEMLLKSNVSLENGIEYSKDAINFIRAEVGLESKEFGVMSLEDIVKEKKELLLYISIEEGKFKRKFLSKVVDTFKKTSNAFRGLENHLKKVKMYLDEIISDEHEEFSENSLLLLSNKLFLDQKIYTDKVDVKSILNVSGLLCDHNIYSVKKTKIGKAEMIKVLVDDKYHDSVVKDRIKYIRSKANISKDLMLVPAYLGGYDVDRNFVHYATFVDPKIKDLTKMSVKPDIINETSPKETIKITVPSRKDIKDLIDYVEKTINTFDKNIAELRSVFEKHNSLLDEYDTDMTNKHGDVFIDYPKEVRFGFNYTVAENNVFYAVVANYGYSCNARLKSILTFAEYSALQYDR